MTAIIPNPTLHKSHPCHRDRAPLAELVAEVQSRIAPLWPLQDFVAVNPFAGWSERDFLSVRAQLRRVRTAEMLLPASYYQAKAQEGAITPADVSAALQECRESYPDRFARQEDWSLERCWQRLCTQNPAMDTVPRQDRAVWTMAEIADQQFGTDWQNLITEEISKFCSAHFDQGQALWSSPWKDQPLYQAWLAMAAWDRRLEFQGIRNLRALVRELPRTPLDAIHHLMSQLGLPQESWREYLLAIVFSVPGWAAYLRYRTRQAEMAGSPDTSPHDDFLGFVAIRLTYDLALRLTFRLNPQPNREPLPSPYVPDDSTFTRYVGLMASEHAYRSWLCRRLVTHALQADQAAPNQASRKSVQMVFCIDVRSEVIRRHLESIAPGVATVGFAGFFGVPLEYLPLGTTNAMGNASPPGEGDAQCPVLLTPSVRMEESVPGEGPMVLAEVQRQRERVRWARWVWKQFQSSAVSCFAFVEAWGLTYAIPLIQSALGRGRDPNATRFDGVPKDLHAKVRPDLGPITNPGHSARQHQTTGLTLDQQVNLAQTILRHWGVPGPLARLVVLCGHGSATVNNPYRAGLDCGACGGHTGEANARVVAQIFNQDAVRKVLRDQGLNIPSDTWFLAALHNTTTDAIEFADTDRIPTSHASDFQALQTWTEQATHRARAERSPRLRADSPTRLPQRSRDWSEVRPEWGLANNAAFIVAPRQATAGLNLGGRTFLHNYDYHNDPDGKTLELILTAPMVVTNWINLQYYASTVDNAAFGSGNKVIHNVVGTFAVLQGNSGDLMTGLPWQSVHDGTNYQHEPLRLLVIVAAPQHALQAILDRHAEVRNLVLNGWLSLIAWLPNQRMVRHTATGTWAEVPLDGSITPSTAQSSP